MSFLYFDYDRSAASIGGEQGIKQVLGLPPVQMQGGVHTFQQALKSVYVWKEVEMTHPVIADDAQETEKRIVPNENGQKHGLEGIVVDSFTRLAQYELNKAKQRMNAQREADGKDKLDNLSRTWWGNYGEMLTRQFAMFAKMDALVIATAHETIDTDDVGKRYHAINIKGSAASKAPEYFDVVAFLGSEGEGKDKDRYLRVADSKAYRQAKDRKDLIGGENGRKYFVRNGELEADALADVVQTYRDNGTQHPNILLVGPSGAGKTLLIGTLNNLTNGTT